MDTTTAAADLAAALERTAAKLRAVEAECRRELQAAQAAYDAAMTAAVDSEDTAADLRDQLEDGPSETWGDALTGVREAATDTARSAKAWRRHVEKLATAIPAAA
jgi:hypothetical protein